MPSTVEAKATAAAMNAATTQPAATAAAELRTTDESAYASVVSRSTHRAHVQHKLGVKSRADLVRIARRYDLITEEPGI